MKNRQNAINFLLLIIIIISCNSSFYGKKWTPELLYEYAKKNNQKNYMIIDPENYLLNADIPILKQKLQLIYNKLNIHTYIIFISYLRISQDEQYLDINEQVQRFTSEFNYILSNDYYYYNDSMSLTTVFFIKERKMRMRTGSLIKKVITDDDALNILNARRDELRNENYHKVVDELINDIYSTYEHNLIYHETFWYKYVDKNTIKTFIGMIFISLFFLCIFKNSVPESQREKKIKEFLDKNKNKQIKNIFNESCIICLDNFQEEEQNKQNKQNNKENKEDKNTLKKEEEKIEEKTTVLECGHKFHDNCIINWLKKNNKCPICRINLNIENNENKSSDYQNNILLGNNNFIGNLIDIQIDVYGDEINETQRSRILSSGSTDSSSDFSGSFDSDSGGATSDW